MHRTHHHDFRKRRAWIAIALLLLVAGGFGIRWAQERNASSGLPDASASSALGKSASRETKSRIRPPRSRDAEGFDEARTKLKRIRIAGFHLKDASVRTATVQLQELILQEEDPERWVSVGATFVGVETPKILRPDNYTTRAGRMNWPLRDFDLEDVSAWQVVERLASDYSMKITELNGAILLIPEGEIED